MPLQVPQLDDRDFDQLVAEVKARIPVHTPEWTNFNDSDPGMTLVQLFAFMTENLLYRSNRIPEANRLKFLTLLGIPLQPATPGRGLVVFDNDRGPIQAWPLDAGIEVRAGKVPFATRTALCILPVSAAVFVKKPKTDLDEETRQQYEQLYEPFKDSASDQLKFYESVPLEEPQIGKPLPEVDLSDTVNGTIDGALWLALLAPPNVPVDAVRAVIAGQPLALGLYPSHRCEEGKVLEPLAAEPERVVDPGLVFEAVVPDLSSPAAPPPARFISLPIEYAEDVLEAPGIVQVTLPAYEIMNSWAFDPIEEGTGEFPPLLEDRSLADRLVVWLRIRRSRQAEGVGDPQRPRQKARLTWVGVNAARVIQALPVKDERLGTANGAPHQVYRVANTPVVADLLMPEPGAEPAATFLLQVQDSLGNWETWQRVDDLYAAQPDSKVYQLDPESGQVSFGDGLRGMRPPLGRAIRVSYEYGGGLEGRVAIGAINRSPHLPGGYKVRNPVGTWGASQGETVAEGERNIARYLRHRDRLVTLSDFRDITMRTPGVDIGRVEALSLFNPDQFSPTLPGQTWPGAVTVMVIPKYAPDQSEPPTPDRQFLAAICAYLNPRRLVTTEIFVRGPEYVPVWVTVGMTTMAGQQRTIVAQRVRAALREYLSPLVGGPPVPGASSVEAVCNDSSLAGSDPCAPARGMGWPLGMEVRSQDLEAVAVRVEGVRYVNRLRLGVLAAGGAGLTEVNVQPIWGIQLPWLAGVSVQEGDAEPLSIFLGEGPDPAQPGQSVPVPVLRKKC